MSGAAARRKGVLVGDAPQKPGRPQADLGQDGKAGGRGRRSSPDAAFDLWLNRNLHSLYDDVAKQPIPPEILALIEGDKKKP